MIKDYTISFEEDEVYEYEDTWPKRVKKTHYPLNSPYTSGNGARLLSFSPGNLASYPIFDDVKVFLLSIYGKAVDNDDDRETWADPIRFEILRRLRYRNWNWYISARGWHPDSVDLSGYIPLDQYLQNSFALSHGLKSIEVRSHLDEKRTFFEVPFALIDEVADAIWSKATTLPIEGYQLPPGSLDILGEWGIEPLDEKLFRKAIDTCSVVFYTWPAENYRFAFLTNKWTLEDMQNMLDVPSLQKMANHIKAQLGK